MQRLYKDTGEGGVLPSMADKSFTVDKEKKHLTAEEYNKYATEKGQKAYDMLRDFVSSKEYSGLTDKEKAQNIKTVFDFANQEAKTTVSNYDTDDWVKELKEAKKDYGIPESKFITLKNQLSTKDPLNLLTEQQRKFVENSVAKESNAEVKRMALFNTEGLTPEQKAFIDKTVISEKKNPVNYENENKFYLSQLTEAKQKRYAQVASATKLSAKSYYLLIDACANVDKTYKKIKADNPKTTIKKKDIYVRALKNKGLNEAQAEAFYNMVFK